MIAGRLYKPHRTRRSARPLYSTLVALGSQFLVEQASDWRRHGKKAGPMRNARMVKAAIDVQGQLGVKVSCYAFPLLGSRGALDCMEQAARAGLEVIPYPGADHETN